METLGGDKQSQNLIHRPQPPSLQPLHCTVGAAGGGKRLREQGWETAFGWGLQSPPFGRRESGLREGQPLPKASWGGRGQGLELICVPRTPTSWRF